MQTKAKLLGSKLQEISSRKFTTSVSALIYMSYARF